MSSEGRAWIAGGGPTPPVVRAGPVCIAAGGGAMPRFPPPNKQAPLFFRTPGAQGACRCIKPHKSHICNESIRKSMGKFKKILHFRGPGNKWDTRMAAFSPWRLCAALLRQIGAFSVQGLQGKCKGRLMGVTELCPPWTAKAEMQAPAKTWALVQADTAAACSPACACGRGAPRGLFPVSLRSASPLSV